MIEMIERTKDCLTGRKDLEILYKIPNFPMYMGVTEQEKEKDELLELVYGISIGSGMMQLVKLVPLEMLYGEIHNSSTGAKWQEHHARFAGFLKKFEPVKVLEIGGANGILEAYFGSKTAGIEWTIIEPNPNPVENCHAKYIKEFWGGGGFLPGTEEDTIVHSHLLEHIYDPVQFLQEVAASLKDGGKMIFSIPNLKAYLEMKYLNALCFEHTYYISEEYIEYLMNMLGFQIIEKEYFYEDHSIFYCTKKCIRVDEKSKLPSLIGMYDKNKLILAEYMNYYYKLIEDLNKRLEKIDSQVYIFGAHIFSQYLIALGLDTTKIISILDNDELKQGKRLYGTDLLVYSPCILKKIKKPTVILKAGSYSQEIREDILKNINATTIFFE